MKLILFAGSFLLPTLAYAKYGRHYSVVWDVIMVFVISLILIKNVFEIIKPKKKQK